MGAIHASEWSITLAGPLQDGQNKQSFLSKKEFASKKMVVWIYGSSSGLHDGKQPAVIRTLVGQIVKKFLAVHAAVYQQDPLIAIFETFCAVLSSETGKDMSES